MRIGAAAWAVAAGLAALAGEAAAAAVWEPIGLAGGGGMFSPACSPLEPNVLMLNCDMSAAYVSRDAGRTWQMIHHSQLRSCTSCSPAFDPKVRGRILAANGWTGQVRVSNDYGLTWRPWGGKPAWRGRPVLLFIDPDDPRRVFVGSGDGMHVTADDGRSWRRCEGLSKPPLGLAADRTTPGGERGVWFVGTGEGVFRSGDGGRNFGPAAAPAAGKAVQSFAGGSDGKVTRLYATVPC